MHRGSGAVVAETEYALSEATKGLTKLDIREQELKDMEVARKLQDEEIKVRKEAKNLIVCAHGWAEESLMCRYTKSDFKLIINPVSKEQVYNRPSVQCSTMSILHTS